MITFCIKVEGKNKAYFMHTSPVLANKFSLPEGPPGCTNKKYLGPHRNSGLVRTNKRLHLGCDTTQILYVSSFKASFFFFCF